MWNLRRKMIWKTRNMIQKRIRNVSKKCKPLSFLLKIAMESQTLVSKWAPREFQNWGVQGNPLTLCQPFANPVPTLRQPCANPSPTLCQPFANPVPTLRHPSPTFANPFCQPLSNPLFPWTPGTRLEARVDGFRRLAICKPCSENSWTKGWKWGVQSRSARNSLKSPFSNHH